MTKTSALDLTRPLPVIFLFQIQHLFEQVVLNNLVIAFCVIHKIMDFVRYCSGATGLEPVHPTSLAACYHYAVSTVTGWHPLQLD